jgi:hypothetical protein
MPGLLPLWVYGWFTVAGAVNNLICGAAGFSWFFMGGWLFVTGRLL